VAYATIDELAAALRVTVTAGNTPKLQSCLDAAAAEINHDIDRPLEEGAVPTAPYLFSTVLAAADPGPGYLRLDRTAPPAAQHLYIDTVDADGADLTAEFAEAALTVDDVVELADEAATGRWERFTLTGPAVNQTGWYDLPVSHTASSPELLDLVEGTRLTVFVLRPSRLLAQGLALAKQVNILRGVEWFKSNDAVFGVIGFAETGALQAPRDGFNRHAYTLTPLKRQWGIA
jgi:hypothetical protein